jgi:hypothetical protein
MTVTQFRRRETVQGWQSAEMNALVAASGDSLEKGIAIGWEMGVTDSGDPQLYLLGPAPDHECLLCVSRLGRLYVLEDGQGRVVFEHDAMNMLAEQVRGSLRRKRSAIVARAVVAWLAIKETFEERVEPMMAEPAEILAHIAPQLAAMV